MGAKEQSRGSQMFSHTSPKSALAGWELSASDLGQQDQPDTKGMPDGL